MIRETELVSYLPPFMQDYGELREALEAEDPEFRMAWEAVDRILYNRFISTADEYGISRYEKVTQIFLEPGMTLEDRRAAVLVKWNEGIPYTLRKLRKVLEAHPGEGAFILDTTHLADYELRLDLLGQELPVIRQIKQTLLKMLPANMYYLLVGRYGFVMQTDILYAAHIGMKMEFYPRQNFGLLRLDNTWKLDADRKLNGYRMDNPLNLYPVRAGVHVEAPVKTTYGTGCRLISGAGFEIKEEPKVRLRSDLCEEVKLENIAALHLETEEPVKIGDMSVLTMNYLDGDWKLDAGRKLNGGREAL